MKFKKFAVIMLAICVLLLCSCTVKTDEDITGDVKNETPIKPVDEINPDDDENQGLDITDVKSDEEKTQNDAKEPLTAQQIIESLGGALSEGGEYKEDAVRLCEAVATKDKAAFAEFTLGKDEYYEFLDKAQITSYTLYPFELTEKTLERLNEQQLYPVAQDNYLVEFEVESSDCEKFTVGSCIYYFGLGMDPVAGNMLQEFVPLERAEEKIASAYNMNYTQRFINEFTALYRGLEDGRNYADSFDFSDSAHLITHLMARSPSYGEPPYTLDEVNGFITESFEGHEGISISKINYSGWTSAGVVYGNGGDPDRIYGCSWGHGGVTAVHDIVNIETDGGRKIVTVKMYADFSKVAEAYTLVFHFDSTNDDYLVLSMVEKQDDTGRKLAVMSV